MKTVKHIQTKRIRQINHLIPEEEAHRSTTNACIPGSRISAGWKPAVVALAALAFRDSLAIFALTTGLVFTSFAQTFPWYPFPIGQLAVQADGKVLVSGRFESIDGVPRTNLARLNLDGTLDRSFLTAGGLERPFEQGINWLGLQGDGKILVAGWSSEGIVRLEADGRLDPTFQPPTLVPSGGLLGVQGGAIQDDGSIVIFGQFGRVGSEVRDGLARVGANGALDYSFNPRLALRGFFGKPEVVAIQDDGKILIGSQFDSVNGTPRTRGLAKLNVDGNLDPLFNPGGEMSFVPILLASAPGGKVYVNGPLGVTRLNADGSLDSQFNPGFGISRTNGGGWPNTLALQNDGRLLLGGTFQFYDGTPRAGLTRILSDGSVDTGFNPQLTLSAQVQSDNHSAYVGSIALQTNGNMLIAGGFTAVGGISRSWIARLNANGEPEETFHAFRPIIQQHDINPDSFFTISIVGETGRPYRVEESTDLINWSALRNFLILGESFEFVDVREPMRPRAFYRVSSN